MEIEINGSEEAKAYSAVAENEVRSYPYDEARAVADPVLVRIANPKAELNRAASFTERIDPYKHSMAIAEVHIELSVDIEKESRRDLPSRTFLFKFKRS